MSLLKVCFLLLVVLLTVEPSKVTKCYDCNSGIGWDHTNCMANGTITEQHVAKFDCPELCYARTNRQFPGTIFRGCSSWFYFPQGRPTTGCVTYKGDDWHFCDTDLCNTMPMTQK